MSDPTKPPAVPMLNALNGLGPMQDDAAPIPGSTRAVASRAQLPAPMRIVSTQPQHFADAHAAIRSRITGVFPPTPSNTQEKK